MNNVCWLVITDFALIQMVHCGSYSNKQINTKTIFVDFDAVYTKVSEELTNAVFRVELKSTGCMFHLLDYTMSQPRRPQ
jgi:hypothetical protein